ncbi:chromosome partitioning protein Smc [Pontibacillus halophilus JSM 076056 = DSM 19796]|uniref:Chromosome partition protein Smc n=1 Tax=Pontibacillus halophilus JSM 076056 = DSM 19796 TaxID=1385510 RepID=A0A0A5GPV1_9BACI|nr:chromosome segregation protein SMC [Pontibacillus halophilus]KGX93195.1 chromosome partitioning protein Smc [Pontibacillus halophilus JSM 076056 = DSM 19796]
MFLKRLDTIGFKSFAERISVDFVPGVTAVVGPNGSGKSNITDAIRWVLGEQSAKSLRGAKMEDVIFSGSDTRKMLNFAEVSLTLDNEDHTLPIEYGEVNITRRVYRSGDSEYYINKQSCRLKDIVELFIDSGLGREAFSIISQGKVEEILSSKAEERRVIFEEAAGVLKYKQRKKKAEQKLTETEDNLNRVEDIIYEIDNQLEPLKEQAAMAKDYLEKKDELEKHEVSLLVSEIQSIHEEWNTLLKQLETEKDKEVEYSTFIQNKEALIESERAEMQTLDESIEDLQESLLQLTQELESLEGKKELFNERHKHYSENKSKLENEVERLRAQHKSLLQQSETEEARLTEWKNKHEETTTHLEEKRNELLALDVNSEERLEELRGEYIELLNNQAAKRNEKQSVEQQLEQLKQKLARLQEKFQGYLTERQTYTDEKEAKQQDLKAREDERKRLEHEVESLNKDLRSKKEEYEKQESKLYEGYQYVQKLRSKKEMLEEMKEDFAGFFQGVKEVLKAREQEQLHGIHGAVAELIDIPNDYMTAIETALGAQAQHVVTKDEGSAREAINWLKRNNSGRATFLPLPTIQPKSVPYDKRNLIEHHEGFVGVASDLVHVDSTFGKAVQHLLGNTIIAKSLKAANEMAASVQRRFRFVTLEGDVVNPGGSMTGGAQKKQNQSLFTRDKELKELTEKLTTFEQKATVFETKVKQLKAEILDKEQQSTKLHEQLQDSRASEQSEKAALREIEIQQQNINDHLHLYDQDKAQYEKEIADLINRNNELHQELEAVEGQLSTIQTTIDELSVQQTSKRTSQEELNQAIQELQVKQAEEQTTIRNQYEKYASLTDQLAAVNDALQLQQNELDTLHELNTSGETEADIQEKVDQKRKQKETNNSLIRARRDDRATRSERVADVERELKEAKRNHASLTQSIQDKEVQATRHDVELDNRLQQLSADYNLSFERAKETYPETTDLEATRTRVKLIRKGIEELGTVNIGAIDEFERIEERHNFLTEQQTDLLDAKSTLTETISEMDVEMERRFSTTFFQIKDEFQLVFRELFGGGQADLQLTNPQDLLNTGIEIVAQPPGKKLQNLGLLSGGERALTAIALLFSILRVRPVPFCVLDEVEAALDEANVTRFAKYLKEFSENTQFIVITHRKGTMEEADVLYGVTMQESGVSRLVSVRLEESKQLINGR